MHWAVSKSEWLKITILQNIWSQRTYPAWKRAVSQTVNILRHWMSVASATLVNLVFTRILPIKSNKDTQSERK